jgi:outer membrane protein assembly factor BamB
MSDRFGALSRRRLLALGGGAVAGSAVLSPDAIRQEMDLSPSVPDDAWPMAGRTPARTARTSAGPEPPLETVWERYVGNSSRTGSLIADERRLYTLADDRLVALDRADGTVVWTYDAFGDDFWSVYPEGPLTIGGGQVFLRADGTLHAVSLADRSLDWRRDGTGSGGVLSVGHVVFTGGNELLALDAATGAVHWRGALDPVAYDDGTLFCVGSTGRLAAYDATTGEREWRTNVALNRYRRGPAVAVTDDAVVVGTVSDGSFGLRGFDRDTGERRFTVDDGRGFVGVAARGTTAYAVRADPSAVLAVSTTDGQVRWVESARSVEPTAPVIAGDVLYVRSDDAVFGLDPDDGTGVVGPVWAPNGHSLVAAGGRLYADAGPRVHALEGSA